ncbi:MAG: outer membrane beta-barrel protein [Pseudomonadota bacterium]|nr:outer membrane beta-barrel protein [Pseudomonadota bacterium]
MRKYLLAAVAAVAIASPAAANDKGGYVGIEAGGMVVQDTDFRYDDGEIERRRGLTIDHEVGYDADIIGGYDFGSFRLEGEAAYKRASIEGVRTDLSPGFFADDVDGDVTVISAMVNGLLDFSDEGSGWGGYVGPGIGVARIKHSFDAPLGDDDNDRFRFSDTGIAWQIVAGVRKHINPATELGLKYRFFTLENVKTTGDEGFDGGEFELDGKFRSHSLLASLIFNFLPPPPPPVVMAPPPPPPMAPATQTCPDGTVILATEVCPLPPPPPPPPAGERG